MSKRLYIDPMECTGCRICELTCAWRNEGALNPKLARLRVERSEPALDMPVACKQCEDAPCIEACPQSAISKDESGTVRVDEEDCIGCGACTEVCPFGAIWLHPERGTALKCDLCGECVSRCPVGALEIVDPGEIAEEKREDYVVEVKEGFVDQHELPSEGEA